METTTYWLSGMAILILLLAIMAIGSAISSIGKEKIRRSKEQKAG